MMQRKPTAIRQGSAKKQAAEPSLAAIRVVVGLGNPSEEYRNTYHNAGAQFAEYFTQTSDASGRTMHTPLFTARRSGPCWIVIPKTFMNESGRAARAALATRKLRPETLLVAHDDSDIPLGEYKFSFGRGAAGHRGVASVISALGTNQFWRLRIGVRHRPGKAGSFVLRQITRAHGDALTAVCGDAYRKLTENETP